MPKQCRECKSMTERLNDAKTKNDFEAARAVHNMMREHLSRVKYPGKHGWSSNE